MLDYELSNTTFEPPNHACTWNMTLDMVDANSGNQVPFEHLMVDFCRAHDNQTKVVVELYCGSHNPISLNIVLLPINDGQWFNLK
jgi:transglutaminase-like putative cysteine protease